MSILDRPESRTLVLIHVEDEDVADLINGELVVIPPNEPVELPEFIANAVLEHKGHVHGIVTVNKIKEKTGTRWDVEEALPRAKEAIIRTEKLLIDTYVRSQLEDRVASGKPALPPSGRVLQLIKKRSINLATAFGLRPVGYREIGEQTPYGSPNVEANDQIKAVTAQNQALREQNFALQQQNERLEAAIHGLSERFGKVEEALQMDDPAPAVEPPPAPVTAGKLKKA